MIQWINLFFHHWKRNTFWRIRGPEKLSLSEQKSRCSSKPFFFFICRVSVYTSCVFSVLHGALVLPVRSCVCCITCVSTYRVTTACKLLMLVVPAPKSRRQSSVHSSYRENMSTLICSISVASCFCNWTYFRWRQDDVEGSKLRGRKDGSDVGGLDQNEKWLTNTGSWLTVELVCSKGGLEDEKSVLSALQTWHYHRHDQKYWLYFCHLKGVYYLTSNIPDIRWRWTVFEYLYMTFI